MAWGSVHWQYLEDMTKVTPHEGTPLKLKKSLLHEGQHQQGPGPGALSKARSQVGDELVVRIELRVDRDMEYVHLKDQRGSGTEPVNVLSAAINTRTAWPITKAPATRPAISSSITCPRAPTSSSIPPGSSTAAIPDRPGRHPVHVRPRVQQPQRKPQPHHEIALSGCAGPCSIGRPMTGPPRTMLFL